MSLKPLTLWSFQLLSIGGGTGLATLCGGLMALRLRLRLDLLAAMGGGAMIGVAFADLLPEAFRLGKGNYDPSMLIFLMLAGFVMYLLLYRASHRGGTLEFAKALGPASLVLHSVIDGLGIGLTLAVSTAAGLSLATAVLAHDFFDGANSVTVSAAGGLRVTSVWFWLILDALAPLVGIGLSRLIAPSAKTLAPLLAIFAGFFLYVAVGELLAKARRRGWLTPSPAAATLALGAIAVITVIAHVSGSI